jgi:hypothetical protein
VAQVALQSPSHLIVQTDVPLHVIVLPPPTSILHIEPWLQVAVDDASSLKSHFDVALHVTVLWSPPAPLHSDVSLQASVNAPPASPSHFDAVVHASEQSPSHDVLQSVPDVHAQSALVHTHPVPLHVGAELSPPQAIVVVAKPKATSHVIRMARS